MSKNNQKILVILKLRDMCFAFANFVLSIAVKWLTFISRAKATFSKTFYPTSNSPQFDDKRTGISDSGVAQLCHLL